MKPSKVFYLIITMMNFALTFMMISESRDREKYHTYLIDKSERRVFDYIDKYFIEKDWWKIKEDQL